MSGALLVLSHPAMPLAWWAANSPPVVSLVSQALSAVGEGARRLADDGAEAEKDDDNTQLMMLLIVSTAVGILVPILLWLIIASMYKGKVTDARGPFPQPVPEVFSLERGDFKYGLFGCCEDFQYFLHGCCAGTIRAADTFQVVSASGYWIVVIAFLLTWFAAQVIGVGIAMGMREMGGLQAGRMQRMTNQAGQIGWFVADAFLALWLAGLRKKLRAQLGDPRPNSSFFPDCVKYWWCSCCTIVQDARQVDGAQGVRVECCCSMTKTMPSPANVGGPVVVGSVIG